MPDELRGSKEAEKSNSGLDYARGFKTVHTRDSIYIPERWRTFLPKVIFVSAKNWRISACHRVPESRYG